MGQAEKTTAKAPTAREILIEAGYQWARAKYPNIPEAELYAIHKNKPRKLNETNGLQNAISDFIKYMGGVCVRVSSAGRQVKDKRTGKMIYIKSTTRKGTPDLSATFAGLPLKIEVKNIATGDAKRGLSPEQLQVKSEEEAAGALYHVATDFMTFYQWWNDEVLKANRPR